MASKENLVMNQDWDKKEHDFGSMEPNVKYDTQFSYRGSKSIRSLATSCGCTVVQHSGGIVSASLKIKPGVKSTRKIVTVIFDDGSTDNLTVKGERQ